MKAIQDVSHAGQRLGVGSVHAAAGAFAAAGALAVALALCLTFAQTAHAAQSDEQSSALRAVPVTNVNTADAPQTTSPTLRDTDSSKSIAQGSDVSGERLSLEQFLTVEFVDHLDIPSGAIKWDVSAAGDESVMAWATRADKAAREYVNGGTLDGYNLFIGSKGTYPAFGASASAFFSGMSHLTGIKNLDKVNTANVTNMSSMFKECPELSSLNLSNFNTSQVTNMSEMFACNDESPSLITLDLANFDTSKVTNMSRMFAGEHSVLRSVNLSNFNTAQVTDMSFMFAGCGRLTSLNLSNFDTANVTTMRNMFSGCSKLATLDLSNLKTSQVTDMSYLFNACVSLTNLNLSNLDTAKVTNMKSMFDDCRKLVSLDLSSFDTSKATNMNTMFLNCPKLKTLVVGNKFIVAKDSRIDLMGTWKNKATSTEYPAVSISFGTAATYERVDMPTTGAKIPMHRLYNKWTGEHFYTANTAERDHLRNVGWSYEGTGWTASEAGVPVYRLYNPYAGDHHYTFSEKERDACEKAGWRYEGIGWYFVYPKNTENVSTVEVWREYNPNAETGTHNYTTDKNEHDTLVKLGWLDESIAWWGVE